MRTLRARRTQEEPRASPDLLRRHPSWGPGPTDYEQLSPQLQGGGSSTEASWHLPQFISGATAES